MAENTPDITDPVGMELASRGLAQVVEQTHALAAPTISLRPEPQVDTVLVGTSRLGGDPDLPAGTPWPLRDGRPLSFVGQVDLSAVTPHDAEGLLPTTGLLSFFYDVEESPWGFDPADRGGWAVVHTPDPSQLERREAPVELTESFPDSVTLVPALTLTYPESLGSLAALLDEEEQDIYWEVLAESGPSHRILGPAVAIQSDGAAMALQCQMVTHGINAGGPEGY